MVTIRSRKDLDELLRTTVAASAEQRARAFAEAFERYNRQYPRLSDVVEWLVRALVVMIVVECGLLVVALLVDSPIVPFGLYLAVVVMICAGVVLWIALSVVLTVRDRFRPPRRHH